MKSEWVALLLVLALCAGACPATIYVDDNAPGDLGPSDPNVGDPQEDGSSQHPFDSVQEAIDAAANGDTIIVAPGRYLSPDPWAYAELKFKGKSIRLVSSAPTSLSMAERTVLGGVVIFQGNEDPNCLLKGFKIQNHDCGGILGNKTQATISHCIISGNGPCGATVLKDVRGRIANCLIVDNTTFHDCGVLPVVSGCPILVNCTIANNASGIALNCADAPKIDQIVIRNCIIWNNQDHEQIQILNRWRALTTQIEYDLIENWNATGGLAGLSGQSTLLEDDPAFAQPGFWEEVPQRPTRESGSTDKAKKILVEGDYHLRSEGWRWNNGQPVHGSPWYFDTSTSPAVDAGDPMDSLGEELERVPGDPEGQWGFNHAIDLGAYGGTKEASLSPTWASPAPGVGAVDLRDYWPSRGIFVNRWFVHNPQGTARWFSMWNTGSFGDFAVSALQTINAPDWVTMVYCVFLYVDQTFYMVTDKAVLNLLPKIPERFQAKYPQYLVVGATIQAPYDPFVKQAVQYRSVVVARGTLAQVLAGTSISPAQFLAGAWPDVIALRGINADGTTGDPIAIFARGFGPLLLAGQPVEGAEVNGKTFGAVEPETPPAARPATRG
jgi:hypothetical protein